MLFSRSLFMLTLHLFSICRRRSHRPKGCKRRWEGRPTRARVLNTSCTLQVGISLHHLSFGHAAIARSKAETTSSAARTYDNGHHNLGTSCRGRTTTAMTTATAMTTTTAALACSTSFSMSLNSSPAGSRSCSIFCSSSEADTSNLARIAYVSSRGPN